MTKEMIRGAAQVPPPIASKQSPAPTAHTRGTWSLADDGTIRAPLDPRGGVLMGDYRGQIICDMAPSAGGWPAISRAFAMPEALANAGLIVASSNLLASLIETLGELESLPELPRGKENRIWNICERARAAIAKAQP